MSSEDKIIWVLGGISNKADKSIPWQEEIPNISNCDILIIDLNTLPEALIESIPYNEIHKYLRYLLMAEKEVYVIFDLKFKRLGMFPIFPRIFEVKPCDILGCNPMSIETIPEEVENYCQYVENCTFFFDGVNYAGLIDSLRLNSKGVERYHFTPYFSRLDITYLLEVLNSANQSIGLSVRCNVIDRNNVVRHRTGNIHFLPPPTKITSSEAVDVLINSILGAEFREEEPDWITKVILPNIDEINTKIVEKQSLIEKYNEELQGLEEKKADIEKHLKLLWTYSTPLENAVRDAFILLGFEEIRRGRAKNLEDWVIDFTIVDEPIHGLFEVKGSEKRTSQGDMNQCLKWVLEYRNEGKVTKGIFVPNQFRRIEKHNSEMRTHFEPNEIKFAKDFHLCVLPTCEIFKAVVDVLKGNEIKREEIEKRILEAGPICKLVD